MGLVIKAAEQRRYGKLLADDQTLPAGVTIQQIDEPLKPWRSVVHWPEIFRALVPSGAQGMTSRWFVPVTCGNPSGSDKCEGKRPAYVLSITRPGVLSVECLASSNHRDVFTGLCKYCFSRKIRIEPRMPDGSEFVMPEGFVWLGLDGEGLEIICGMCKTKQTLSCDLPVRDDYTWKCIHCVHGIGEWDHPSGARVFWLVYWLRRILERPGKAAKVPFTCANAKCGRLDLVWHQAVRLKGEPVKKWRGLCDDSRADYTYLRDYTDDVHDVGPFKVSILYSRREGNQVPVPCPLPNCSEENWFNVSRTTGEQRNELVGVCKSHKRAEILAFQTQNGKGQKNGGAEARGRKKKLKGDDRRNLLPRFEHLCDDLSAVELMFQTSYKSFERIHPNHTDADLRNWWAEHGIALFTNLRREAVLRLAEPDSPSCEEVAYEELAHESGYATSTLRRFILPELRLSRARG